MSTIQYLTLVKNRIGKICMCALFITAVSYPMTGAAALSDIPKEELAITEKKIKAARFLHQASFGPTSDEVFRLAKRMQKVGDTRAFNEWITAQLYVADKDKTSFERLARDMIATDGFAVDSKAADVPGLNYAIQNYKHHAWWNRALKGEDQLRQRMAWALIQIMVISENGMGLNARNNGHWLGILNYYDMLMDNAFGNYRTLLEDVTLHPAMGLYLSHVKNSKGDPSKGIFPDENYAREVLQLFSIGVYALNNDGSFILDAEGNPIETYNNETIRNFARVFTGLTYAPTNGRDSFQRNQRYMLEPMKMYDDFHDMDEKFLLQGQQLPAGQGGLADLRGGLDNIFNHPNVPPFIARALIQRFTSSNPSPRYIRDVANVFSDDGKGQRGNLSKVIRKILMHPEARNTISINYTKQPNGLYSMSVKGKSQHQGKLREPQLALTAMYRAFNASAASSDGLFRAVSSGNITSQGPFSSPSVFNFYSPNYQPAGVLQNLGLYSPEYQIYTPVMINNLSNFLRVRVRQTTFGLRENGTLDLSAELGLGQSPQALTNHLDLLLTYGTLNQDVAQEVINAISSTNNIDHRCKLAIVALLGSPDFIVME